MMLFDTHAHLDMKNSTPQESEEALVRAYAAGVSRITAIAGSDTPGDFSKTFEIASRHPQVVVAVGVHPHAASDLSAGVLDKVRFALDKDKVVALGEIGLDYHYNFSEPKEQRVAFIKQLQAAHAAKRPVVIHTREADEDTLAILQDHGAGELGGVIHCFSSGAAFAEGALSLGFYLSFSGIVTFPKTDDILEISYSMPLDRMLCETDSPYLAPMPHRGQKNEPAFVRHVMEKLAAVREMSQEDMADTVFHNAVRCFGLQADSFSDASKQRKIR